jgi:hypothetical protein
MDGSGIVADWAIWGPDKREGQRVKRRDEGEGEFL